MLYTRKGDDGKTKDFKGDDRHSKNSIKTEALGTVDELNSFLGLVKVKGKTSDLSFNGVGLDAIVHEVQKNLFIVQAEMAGAEKNIKEEKIKNMEAVIDDIEKKLPELKQFAISGGTEMNALLHTARAIARRAERKTVAYHEEVRELNEQTRQYMNRLSSLLYALARLANHLSGINEESPDYE